MPEKFDDMVRLWNEACKAEVVANYMPYDSDSITVRASPPSDVTAIT